MTATTITADNVDEYTMSTTIYQIEQHTGYQFEAIDNGDFATVDAAQRAIIDLVTVCGWDASSLRIVECAVNGNEVTTGEVVG